MKIYTVDKRTLRSRGEKDFATYGLWIDSSGVLRVNYTDEKGNAKTILFNAEEVEKIKSKIIKNQEGKI